MGIEYNQEFKVELVEKEIFSVELKTVDIVPGGNRYGLTIINNFTATSAPTVNDDSDDDYEVGSSWVNISADKSYICVDATVGAAIWRQTDIITHQALYNHALLHTQNTDSKLDEGGANEISASQLKTDSTKLSGIEDNATIDQTDLEIQTAAKADTDIADSITKKHNSSLIGTKTIDETDIANGKIIKYNATSGKLEYETAGAATGDMLKSTYDTDNDGIVDKAESIDDGTYSATAQDIQDSITKKHTHSNKTVLDNIQEAFTAALKSAYDSCVTNEHTHSNKATLDLIEEAFTSALKIAYDACVTDKHTHANKATLDLIEQALTSALKIAYDDAVTKAHIQDTDQKLDEGGANEVTAAETKTAYTHSQVSSGNPHSVTKTEVGLSNVTNNEQIPLVQKAAANGVATLGADSKIPTAQLPDLSITDIHTATSEAAQLALSVQKGDVCVRSDENKSYIALNSDNIDIGDWQELLTPTDSVTSVNGNTGVVVLTTTDIAEGTNEYYTEVKVSANSDVSANTSARHTQNSDTDLDATFEATFVKKADTINVLSDITSAGADIESAVSLKHAESHNIASHSDTIATGTQLNTLVGGGDTSLHKHDTYALDTDLSTHESDTTAIHGITDTSDLALKSGNVNQFSDITSTGANIEDAVTKKHSQNTDTQLGTMAADINMNSHKLTGLSVPSSNGDSIRATTKITETNLESVIDNNHVAVTVAGAPLTLSTQEITFNYDTDDFALDGNNLSLKADGIKDVHIDWGTGANQVNSDDIPNYNGHTIYDTFCHILNRGIAEAVTVTLTGGLGISWTTGELFDPPNCLFIATDSGSGNVTDNTVNYLKWVSGTALTLSTTIATGNEILVATISVYDGVINGYREVILMDSNISNTRRALRESFPTRVINGMSVYEDTDVTNALDVTMDTGVFYKDGIERKTPVEIKSRNTAMVRHYHTTGTWDYDTNAEIDMANYDNPGKAGGQGLEALPSNKWVKSYFIFMNGKIGWIYPTEYFNTQGQAIAASLPAIPTGLTPLPKLTAIVYNSNHTTFTNTTWQDIRAGISEETFNLVTDHGSLAGLSDDDHTQYILVDGTRAFTGNVDLGANSLTINSIEIIGVDGEVNKAAVEDSGDWDTAYTHSQLTSGNPHSVTPTELSLVIGTNVQAYDDALASISGLAYVSASFIKLTAEDTYAVRTIAEVKTDLSLNNVSNVATDDTAYNATSWDNNSDAATKNAIRDKIETMDTAIGLNTAKNTNVSTELSVGTVGVNTVAITSDGGADDVTLPAATVSTAGMLTTTKWADIVANNAKVTNATHTGDVTGSGALALDPTCIYGKADTTIVAADYLLFWDNTDSLLKKVDAGELLAGASLPVVDTTGIAKGSVDATKIVRLEVDGLTTATTRVLTVQDKDYTIADNADVALKSPIDSPTFTTKITTPIIDLTGGQIAFPATAVPSADPNTIDDYEEGTWTPTLTGTDIAFTQDQDGFYVAIGKMVYLQGTIIVSGVATGTLGNAVTITGLPFTSENISARYGSVSFEWIDDVDYPAGALELGSRIVNNSTAIGLYFSFDDAPAVTVKGNDFDDASLYLVFRGSYTK